MAEFQEIPQIVFEVIEDGEVKYRDAITYPTVTDLRNDNKAEREAKFQERYEHWLAGGDENPLIEES